MLAWNSLPQRPLVVAHRGSSATAPENTLAAFSQAIEDGADAIELDVRLTKDEQVIVFHDARLERTTNGSGRVCDCSLSTITVCSAGGWFHSRFRDERVPTLEEVFELVNGKLGINIELKHEGTKRGIVLVEKTIQLVKHFDSESSVLLSSFHHNLIKQARRYSNTITTGLLYHALKALPFLPGRAANAASAQHIICSKRLLTKRMVTVIHSKKLSCGVYTVNTEQELAKCLRFGVDCIITNDPKRLLTAFSSIKIPHLGD